MTVLEGEKKPVEPVMENEVSPLMIYEETRM